MKNNGSEIFIIVRVIRHRGIRGDNDEKDAERRAKSFGWLPRL